VTRPSIISLSASRREATPWSDRIFCSRSPGDAAGGEPDLLMALPFGYTSQPH